MLSKVINLICLYLAVRTHSELARRFCGFYYNNFAFFCLSWVSSFYFFTFSPVHPLTCSPINPFTLLVEVAGIEPASRKPITRKSTYLVVFILRKAVKDNQTCFSAADFSWVELISNQFYRIRTVPTPNLLPTDRRS